MTIHQLAHLVDEPVDHNLDAKVAGQRLARLEERLLLGEPAVALAEQPARVDGDRGLQGDGLGERDLGARPASRFGAVQTEHPDHSIERDDRCRQDGTDAPVDQLAHVAQRRVVQLRSLEHVADRNRAAVAGRQVGHGQAARVAEWVDTPGCPLRQHRRRLAGLAEADEAALDVRRLSGLLDRDLQELVEIAARADGARDPGDQALAFERVGDRIRRARPLEGQARIGGECLHQVELVQVEETR